MQAQVFTLGYLKGSEEETAHKRYTAAELEKEHDTVELCMACPCTQRASANIDAFPSAIVLPKQKLQDHSLEKKQQPNISPLTSSLPLTHSQRSTLWLMEWTLQLKLKGRIWTASLAWILWTTEALETICRHVVQRCAIFIPVQPFCSSTCHLHSELPAVDLLTAAEREGSHNSSSSARGGGADVAYILYLAVTTLFCFLVQLKWTFVGNNISANNKRKILTHVKYSKPEALDVCERSKLQRLQVTHNAFILFIFCIF